MQTKRCNRCGIEKSTRDFRTITRRSGPSAGYSFLGGYCIPCDRERVSEQQKADRTGNNRAGAKHREKRLADDPDAWRRYNAEKVARYRERHPDREKAARLKWNAANPGKVNEHNHRARAQQVGVVNYREIIERDKAACYLCGLPVDITLPKRDPMSKHFDHVIPLSKGGPHSMGNIRLTHAKCNYKKAARLHEADDPIKEDL